MDIRETREREPEIKFEALTDGLGFHPFSNGLPYAPRTQAPTPQSRPSISTSMGTGATVAGTPTFARELPRISVPMGTARPATPALPHRPIVNPERPPSAELLSVEPSLGWIYLFKRVFAYGIDSVINLGLGVGALTLSLWRQGMNIDILFTPGILLAAALFLAFFNWAMIAAQEVAFGTSIGKRALGLYVHGSAGTILLRAILFAPSLLFCGLGLLWAAFDPHKRAWHDRASGLQPSEIASL